MFFKVGTRGFNEISIKLLNRCVRLSGYITDDFMFV